MPLKFKETHILHNALFGVLANVVQNVLLSVFFILLARLYDTDDFGRYIIANTLYATLLSVSSFGMGHWFIRTYVNSEEKSGLVRDFFSFQLLSGIAFYLFNILLAYLLYDHPVIRSLSLILGINLIFDNIIYVIKTYNTAEQKSYKSNIIALVDSFLKVLAALLLLMYKVDILWLSLALILIRFLTLHLFIQYGFDRQYRLRSMLLARHDFSIFWDTLRKNWYFAIISSIAILNWRISGLMASKMLSLQEVAVYEIAFKLFSVAYLVPVIFSSVVYPRLVERYRTGLPALQELYQALHTPMILYGLFTWVSMYTFSGWLIPLLFGSEYQGAVAVSNQLFWIMLVFPTLFLQANVMIVLGLEKTDMWLNICNISLNVLGIVLLFGFWGDLRAFTYSSFFAFLIFHLLQDYFLWRKKVVTVKDILGDYLLIGLSVALFLSALTWVSSWVVFSVFTACITYYLYRGRKQLAQIFS